MFGQNSQNSFAQMMKNFTAPFMGANTNMFDTSAFTQAFKMPDMTKGFDLSSMKSMFPNDFMKSWESAFSGLKSGNMNAMMGDMPKMGNVDWSALMDSQKKNMEAMQAAQHTMMGMMQQSGQCLSDMFRQTMQTAAQLSTDMMSTGTPEEKLGRQVDIVKQAFDIYNKHMRELTELSAKSQAEAMEMFSSRITTSLDELKETAKQAESRFHEAAMKADLNGMAAKASQTTANMAKGAVDTVAATGDAVH